MTAPGARFDEYYAVAVLLVEEGDAVRAEPATGGGAVSVTRPLDHCICMENCY